MRRILVAIDGSDCSFRAVAYCGLQFSGLGDLSFTLFHVLPYLPPRIWDIGHILSEEEEKAQARLVEAWLEDRRAASEGMFDRAAAMLRTAGFGPEQVERKLKSDSTDTAGSILEEARDGKYLTLVIGRCGSRFGEVFLGSTTSRIVNHGAGLAICVVE